MNKAIGTVPTPCLGEHDIAMPQKSGIKPTRIEAMLESDSLVAPASETDDC